MGIDIRLPLGLMFSLLGVVLVIAGLVMGNEIYARSLGININFWWGLVLLVFGVVMFAFGRRGTATFRLAEESIEGRKIEEMEDQAELESNGDDAK
ncbi:MAG: hypothetical protein DMF62_06775 [Acidobacteria bacterium]|nr:MAG: hypothetical protein DMF62_06775 [Acidobacteriota bacterium]